VFLQKQDILFFQRAWAKPPKRTVYKELFMNIAYCLNIVIQICKIKDYSKIFIIHDNSKEQKAIYVRYFANFG
jgi:hypothetical protein